MTCRKPELYKLFFTQVLYKKSVSTDIYEKYPDGIRKKEVFSRSPAWLMVVL